MNSNLTFGLRNGYLMHISDVESGLVCGCYCPSCNKRLIARKGKKTVHHFAHHQSRECEGAVQTAIHIAAKEILEKERKILLPEVRTALGCVEGQSICLYAQHFLHFDQVYLEKRLHRIIPDILILKKGKPLIIEIIVTHPADQRKINIIRSLNISTLEIDLLNADTSFTLSELEKQVVYGTSNKRWLYNAKREAFHQEIQNLGKSLRLCHRKVYGCPLPGNQGENRAHADLLDDCFYCNYFIHAYGETSGGPKHIVCAGHARKEIEMIISRIKKG